MELEITIEQAWKIIRDKVGNLTNIYILVKDPSIFEDGTGSWFDEMYNILDPPDVDENITHYFSFIKEKYLKEHLDFFKYHKFINLNAYKIIPSIKLEV